MSAEPSDTVKRAAPPAPAQDYYDLSRRILECAIRARSRIDFLREVSELLLNFSRCDALELRASDGAVSYRWKARRLPSPLFELEVLPGAEALGKVAGQGLP